MEKDQINRHFLAYAAASRDLNPIIDGKPYPLPRKQGEFFFHYKLMQEDPAYREKNFYWMHNFKVLLTNGSPCMPPERLDELTQYGSVNFFYNAFGGFYEFDAFKSLRGELPESDFGDPPCTILLDDDGRRLPAEQPDGPWRYDMV